MADKNEKGFSFLELFLVVSIAGILLYITVPRLKFDTLGRYKADAVARRIVADLRYARSLAISDAATNSNGYELKMTGGSPYNGYEIVNQKTSATVASCTIDSDITVTTTGGIAAKFGPLGDVQSGSFRFANVTAQGRTFTITPVIATGIVKCVKQ